MIDELSGVIAESDPVIVAIVDHRRAKLLLDVDAFDQDVKDLLDPANLRDNTEFDGELGEELGQLREVAVPNPFGHILQPVANVLDPGVKRLGIGVEVEVSPANAAPVHHPERSGEVLKVRLAAAKVPLHVSHGLHNPRHHVTEIIRTRVARRPLRQVVHGLADLGTSGAVVMTRKGLESAIDFGVQVARGLPEDGWMAMVTLT